MSVRTLAEMAPLDSTIRPPAAERRKPEMLHLVWVRCKRRARHDPFSLTNLISSHSRTVTAKLIYNSGEEDRSERWSDSQQCQYRRELEYTARTLIQELTPTSVLNIAVLRVVERAMRSPGAPLTAAS
jgi:hypothetical protein